MEFSGVIVLALVSCVTGTPHGYGVNSGALAKAEANAASGTFGVLPAVPLSIPSGGSYSGSFSKSSSSSFASSSSSSSASSSSFTFGGSGATGIAGNSVPSTLHGSPSIQHGFGANGASASAAAGAIAGSTSFSHNGGLPCTGNNCNKLGHSNNKCTSIDCSLSDHQHNINSNNNCLTGQCQTTPSVGISTNTNGADLQTVHSPSIQEDKDWNDFEVNIGGKSKSTNNQSGHISNLDKNRPQTDCSLGKCGTNIGSSHASLPSTILSNHNEQPSTKNCNTLNSGCDTFIPLTSSGGATVPNSQPATHLTTPIIGPACSTHNCNLPPTDSHVNDGKPSSYHVPILGENPGGISPYYNTNAHPTEPLYEVPSKSDNTVKIPNYSPLPSSSAGLDCKGPNCNAFNNPAHQPPNNPSCNSPNCGTYPVDSRPNSQSASFDLSGSNSKSESKYDHNILPGYTNGLLKPSYSNPSVNTGSFNPGPSKTSTDIFTPNQNKPGYTVGLGSANVQSGHDLHSISKPGSSNSGQNIPVYTGGFGGSVGSFDTQTIAGSHYQSKPSNEHPSYGPNILGHNNGVATTAGSGQVSFALPTPDSGSVSSSHNSPSYTGVTHLDSNPTYKPSSSSITTPQNFGSGGVTVPGHGSFGIKPESGAGSDSQKAPTYTGGFGGSPGTFDTISKVGTHIESKPTHDKLPSGPDSTPSGNLNDSGTLVKPGSGYYNSHDAQKPSENLTPPYSGNFGASNTLKPGEVNELKPIHEKTTLPPYLGGFGGPSGILKPNEFTSATKQPTSSLGTPPCHNGGCDPAAIHSVPNGKDTLSSGSFSDASASANAKAIAYSGGFGGPPGLLKPFDDGKHSKNGQGERSGKFGEHENSASGINSAYGNSLSLNDNHNVHKAPSDSVNTANANANAVAYASSNAFSANQGLSSSGCKSGCGSNYDSGAGGSYASSLGLSNAGVLGGLNGGSASANSAAGAGTASFETGRSFASSLATAHASAGAAVKGGYGRR